MYFQQHYLACLSHASYFIADEKTKTAIVVDPQRDIDIYLQDAKDNGFSIKHVFLTHFHADFLAGHIELQKTCDAQIHLGAQAKADYFFVPAYDGDQYIYGDLKIGILETPGHTPEGICLLLYDLSQSEDRPQIVLTGDTLFVGDVGRPDLMASVGYTSEQLASCLYDSIHQKILTLPDETVIYPAHGAGSMCGKKLSSESSDTLGSQKKLNYALRPMEREAFIKLITSEQPQAPKYFSYDAALNQKQRPTLAQSFEQSHKQLSFDELTTLRDQEVQLLDVRSSDDFSKGHVAESIHISLDGRFASWCGTVLDHQRPIAVIAKCDQEKEALTRLGRIGFDQVEGFYIFDLEDFSQSTSDLKKTHRLTSDQLQHMILEKQEFIILDVRTLPEWKNGHIDDSQNIPLSELVERCHEICSDIPLVVHCQTGYRSSIAVSLLSKLGQENLYDLVGGYEAYQAQQAVTT